MNHIRRILVIRLSSFGDIVLTYNFIIRLRGTFPQAEIHFLVKGKYRQLLEVMPDIDKIFTITPDDTIMGIRKTIAKYRYDLIFDLSNHLKTRLMTAFLGSKKIRFRKDYIKKLCLIWFKTNYFKEIIPVYRKYLLTLTSIMPDIDMEYIPVLKNLQTERLLTDKYIVLAPSAGHYTKTFPKERFVELFRDLFKESGFKIVLVGDKNPVDMEICGYLEANLSGSLNYCGKTDFRQLMCLIQHSEYVVCNDSGVLHLSEAFNKRTFVFFGSTVKEFGFYPQLVTTKVFENSEISCRPCTKIGRSSCPRKHFKCMLDIKVNPQDIK